MPSEIQCHDHALVRDDVIAHVTPTKRWCGRTVLSVPAVEPVDRTGHIEDEVLLQLHWATLTEVLHTLRTLALTARLACSPALSHLCAGTARQAQCCGPWRLGSSPSERQAPDGPGGVQWCGTPADQDHRRVDGVEPPWPIRSENPPPARRLDKGVSGSGPRSVPARG